jgi:hypothetical protein
MARRFFILIENHYRLRQGFKSLSGLRFLIILSRLTSPPRRRQNVEKQGGERPFEEADDDFIADGMFRRLLSRSARAVVGI